jgi:hypothetical protein
LAPIRLSQPDFWIPQRSIEIAFPRPFHPGFLVSRAAIVLGWSELVFLARGLSRFRNHLQDAVFDRVETEFPGAWVMASWQHILKNLTARSAEVSALAVPPSTTAGSELFDLRQDRAHGGRANNEKGNSSNKDFEGVYDAVEGEVVTMPKPLLRPMRLASQRAVVMHDDERVRPDVRAMIADERARCGRGQCRFCAHLREGKPDWWEVCEDPSGIELTPMCMFCGPKERKAWLTGGAI